MCAPSTSAMHRKGTKLKYINQIKSRQLKNYLYCTVVGTAKVTKSNLPNFWYRCLVIDLVLISEVLSQASLACTSYTNKRTLIRVNFQVRTDQWMVQNVIAALTAAKPDG